MKEVNLLDHILNFLAVIVGVSMAFYVNDYASNRKEKREVDYLIQAVYDELMDDIETYETYQIPDNNKKSAYLSEAIAIMTSRTKEDSLDSYLSKSFDINSYSPQNVSFNSIVSSGKLDLIDDFQLRSMLLTYSLSSKEVEAQGDAQYDYFMNQLIPWFISHPEYVEGVDLEADNASFILLATLYLSLQSNKVRKYKGVVEEAKSLTAYLEKEYEFLILKEVEEENNHK